MESTGSYWNPVFQCFKRRVKVYVPNPQDGESSERAQDG